MIAYKIKWGLNGFVIGMYYISIIFDIQEGFNLFGFIFATIMVILFIILMNYVFRNDKQLKGGVKNGRKKTK